MVGESGRDDYPYNFTIFGRMPELVSADQGSFFHSMKSAKW